MQLQKLVYACLDYSGLDYCRLDYLGRLDYRHLEY